MAEGLRFALSDPRTRVLLVVGVLPFFLLIPVFGTLYPIYAKDEFAAGPTGLGLLLTAVGVGGTLGGFIANALGRAERQGRIQSVWVVVMARVDHRRSAQSFARRSAIAVQRASAAPRKWRTPRATWRCCRCRRPEAMRGRISALLMLNPALISMGAFIAGPLSDAVGVRGASIILAGAAIAAIGRALSRLHPS